MQSAASKLSEVMKETEFLLKNDGYKEAELRLSMAEEHCKAIEKSFDFVTSTLSDLSQNVDDWKKQLEELARITEKYAHDPPIDDFLLGIDDASSEDERNSRDTNTPNIQSAVLDADSVCVKNEIDSTGDVEPIAQINHALPLCPRAPDNVKIDLELDDQCYASRDNKSWHPGSVASVVGEEYIIKFINGQLPTTRLPKSRVSFFLYPDWLLPVGTRIIAIFRASFLHPSENWVGGIVGEPPSPRNGNRYLVFFDNGEAQYVYYTSVRCICKSIVKYEDMDVDNPQVKAFMIDYIKKYPERAVVRLRVDEIVKVMYDGVFHKTKVVKLDFMLVRVQFNPQHCEWLYRGDKRLEPIATREADVQASIESGRRRHRRTVRPANGPVVEYISDDENDGGLPVEHALGASSSSTVNAAAAAAAAPSTATADSLHRSLPIQTPLVQTARKSTTGRPGAVLGGAGSLTRAVGGSSTSLSSTVTEHQAPSGGRPSRWTAAAAAAVSCEDKDIIDVAFQIDRSWKSPITRHVCSADCLVVASCPAAHKGQNPLLIPILCGWDRMISTTNQRRRHVIYEAPCSKRLTSMEQVAAYLDITGCQITIDCFCFDAHVRPARKMILRNAVKFHREDYSAGNENVPIECVNSINDDSPAPLSYQSIRYTTDEKVDLNLASEFLSGCDCEGDCSDRDSCACQQLTLAAHGKELNGFRASYEYRRLPRGVVFSGIYECNDLCKCRKSCFNRVAQNPLTACLQLFKTSECGWGVRTLFDIPKGSFICVYAGNVLSDEKANEVGKTQGDEYFADLDFAAQASDSKEGFEPTALVPTDSEDDDERAATVASPAATIELSSDDEEAATTTSKPRPDSTALSGSAARKRPRISLDQADNNMDCTIATVPTFVPSAPCSTGSAKRWYLTEYIGEENIYTLDAKLSGNIGRFLNHSCSPNVFVQNVFVDTHVLTLPWVAFFAQHRIKAGTELCWDYNYAVGSVPGKEIKCKCRSANCRGRLL